MFKKTVTFIVSLLLIFSIYTPCSQAQTGVDSLSLDQAYKMAIANSNDLKQQNYSIDRANEVRDSLATDAEGLASGEASSNMSLIGGLASADVSLGMADKQKSIIEEQIKYSVLSKYTSIITASNNLEYAKKNKEYIEAQRFISSLSHEIGMVSDYDYGKVNTNYELVKTNLDSTQAALDKAYLEFNSLVGLQPSDRPSLTDKIEYQSYTNTVDPTNTVAAIVAANPAAWLKDKNIELAQLQLILHNWNGSTPYAAEEIDIDKAELSATQLDEQLRNSLSTLFKSLEQLEDSYAAEQKTLALAQKDLDVLKIKYDLGLCTKLDLQQAELAVEKAQNDLQSIAIQHEITKQAFLKPWAASN